MKTIDLHVHSYYSDGAESPKDLVMAAIGKRFSVFSIADHNYISPEQSRLQKIAADRGVLFIQGIEVSCVDKKTDKSLHILGYSNYFNYEKINRKMLPVIKGYNVRAKKIIGKLNKKYSVGFDFDKIRSEAPSVIVSRNYLAKRLSNFLGGKLSPEQLLPEIFIEEDDSWMPDPKEAIEIIKECNGTAILAHPGNLIDSDCFEDIIKRLIDYGLAGIEVYTLKHSARVVNMLKKIAEKYDLIMTGGSDWHGGLKEKDEEGLEVPDKIYNRLSEIFRPEKSPMTNKSFLPIRVSR